MIYFFLKEKKFNKGFKKYNSPISYFIPKKIFQNSLMNSQNNLTGSKYHQSPNHFQKQQESTTQTTAKQLLNQVPAKNLRNPDYYITSILAQPGIKVYYILQIF